QNTYVIDNILFEDRKNIPVQEQPLFLQSVLTEKQANNIYKVYSKDDDIIEMIQKNTFDYKKVKGIDEKTYQKVQQKIKNGMSKSEILVFMTKHGIKYNHVKPLVDKYGSKEIAMQKLKGNPYLLTNVKGIGFKKADEIAYIMKYDMKSENRIKACVLYIIEEVNQNGNSWINQRQMFNRLIDYLGIEKERIQEVLNKEIKGITCVDGKYTKTVIYETEKYIADKIKYALTNVK